jgi:hypothetical protein
MRAKRPNGLCVSIIDPVIFSIAAGRKGILERLKKAFLNYGTMDKSSRIVR